ncbi:MAG: PTS sugar transporter subunit IIA [Kiritimatiellae bacterium]|nr:PTS sugar transporter subunit IIA [Kiritimatiellia bacterium]
MQLTVNDAAALLKLPERTIRRWIKQDLIPVCRVNDQIRFNRTELLEWATTRGLPVSPDIFHAPRAEDACAPAFSAALASGGIFYGIEGRDKEQALRAVVRTINLPRDVDRELLLNVLLAREAMASTGVGEGIAIPHVRNPIVLSVRQPVVGLCFLKQPVEFGALDGQPVHTLFTLVSPTVRLHLHLLSRLTFALRDDTFKRAIGARAPAEEIVAAARAVETRLGAKA